jgi:heptosyltransferase-2
MNHSRKQNISLLVHSFGRFLTKGRSRGNITNPERIVIIQSTRNLGDMVVSTPVFRAIKTHFPKSWLCVVGTEKNRETLWGNPDVDEYIAEPDSADELIKILRSRKYDFGATINPSLVDLASMYLAGIPSISAFELAHEKSMANRPYNILKSVAHVRQFKNGVYIPREYLKLLEPIGIITDITKKFLYYRREGEQTVLKQLSESGINPDTDFLAVISPGAGTKIKQWPPERFAAMANYLSKTYNAKIVVIGGGKDRSEIDGVIARFDPGVVYGNFFNQSLDELKALLSKCDLIIANDSGPVYIAESFEVPTLVIVGPTDEAEHPPKGLLNRVVKAPDRGEALLGAHIAMNYDQTEARRQIEAVTIEMVQSEVDSLMKEIGGVDYSKKQN